MQQTETNCTRRVQHLVKKFLALNTSRRAVLQFSERNRSRREDFEEFVNEPILTPDATPAQPPHLALLNYVHRLIALNRSLRSVEFSIPLLGVHSPLDRAMVLLDDVVQILDGSMAARASEHLFLL
jgi:hypothetical protein